ncbi:AAA family ATPase [Ornithinimicrobium cryptoxanthini]|uniref:AAA family ATPase n=1 Tax=Ornithinimicrobium cryptoxanthini TaxID=2934161 RepID=UPI002118E612|nr:AAA family ATPase [Ornithinimicrobium cryptoxanthini]
MIRTIAIQGYRSIRDLALELSGLDVVTGANGSGKSNLYRALRLLAGCADGSVVGAIARDGGLGSILWAGPERPAKEVVAGHAPAQGTVRRGPVGLRLGYSGDDLGYLVDLGIPPPGHSPFVNDPEIKREQVFHGAVARAGSLLVDRHGPVVKVREGAWRTLDWQVAPSESLLAEAVGLEDAPEIAAVRGAIRGWRFYDHFRTDVDAPARQPCIGTVSPVLAADGGNLAAVLTTISFQGDQDGVQSAVDAAFPGSSLGLSQLDDGRVQASLRQPGLLRPLRPTELSDGTLRYLLLVAALKTTRPPGLMVLNEPETSLHRDLLPALATLIADAAPSTQVVVVTHSPELIESLVEQGARRHELTKDAAGTRSAQDGGLLSGPRWEWPRR